MAPKIDAKELGEIVEETARIQEREAGALDAEQARDVLRELELPADRLEQARAAVQLRRAQAHERSGRLKLAALVATLLLIVAALLGWRAYARGAALEQVSASQTALALNGVPLASPSAVARSAQPDVGLEAVLAHAPAESSLELTCDWLDPNGQARYQSHWQTKSIDKELWPTHCRHRFGPADASGEWSVQMKLGDRVLGAQKFRLE